jgi:hypothetical protein
VPRLSPEMMVLTYPMYEYCFGGQAFYRNDTEGRVRERSAGRTCTIVLYRNSLTSPIDTSRRLTSSTMKGGLVGLCRGSSQSSLHPWPLVPRVSSQARALRKSFGVSGTGKGKSTLCMSARTQPDDRLILFAVIDSPVDSRCSLTQR